MHILDSLAYYLLLLLLPILTQAQFVSPFATHDCSKQVYYIGDHACSNDLTKYCAATGICCAGGCCPYDAVCAFSGTANEGCCPLSDKTGCDAVAPPSSTPTCAPGFTADIPCSGLGSSWHCPAKCTCNVSSYEPPCNYIGAACVPAVGGSSSSIKPVASSTSAPAPLPKSSTSSSEPLIVNTPISTPLATSAVSSADTSAPSQAQSTTRIPAASGSKTSTQITRSSVSSQSSGGTAATTVTGDAGLSAEKKYLDRILLTELVLGIMFAL